MSEVKRYVTTCDCMSEASWGDYVRHADYDALAAECVIQKNTAQGANNQLKANRLETEKLAKAWLTAIAERDAALAELAASDQALRESRANDMESMRQLAEARAELAALKGGQEAVAIVRTVPGTDWKALDFVAGFSLQDQAELTQLYTAPPAQASAWVPASERLPEVPEGDEQEVIVCVRRSHNGQSYVFSARYLNKFPLYNLDHPDADEDGCLPTTGWHDVKEHSDYDGWYSPLIETEGDEVTHWMPLPADPTPGASDVE